MAPSNYDKILNAIESLTALIVAQGSKADHTNERLDAIEQHLSRLNGTVATNCLEIARLQAADKLLSDGANRNEKAIGLLSDREREASIAQARNAGIWGFLAGLIPAILQYLTSH